MGMRPAGDTVDILEKLLAPLQGRRILDIGCGRGNLLQALVERGASVAGLDPDEVMLEVAQALVPKAVLKQGCAQLLPWGDTSMHAAIFLNSLHHVPAPDMLLALEEAARVVGKGGSVIVVESLSEGSFFDTLRLIEDETEVRQAAQDAIVRARRRGIVSEIRRVEYDRIEAFPDAEAFLARAVTIDPSREARAQAARGKLLDRFEALSEHEKGGYVLHQPLRLHHLKVPVAAKPAGILTTYS
ncbi:MAG TPA: class I SAM-dependent methyltransferase [Bosea sp. (in: a-proteobacteria)]|jgi:ubiquinone/menaquinone biosynthesis C-methylase UbiE|nr:class I SAM-dependent methyltransferase [Bosea sp. (in: a-proteobacteria)]